METSSKNLSSVTSQVTDASQDPEASHHEFFENHSIESLTWSDIDVSIKDRKIEGYKSILTSCSGRVERGQVLALMGPSGSGKSTILNILASRTRLSYTGSVHVNGSAISGTSMHDISAYVQQEDRNLGGLTVAESIRFTSRLANPDISKQQQAWHNEEVI